MRASKFSVLVALIGIFGAAGFVLWSHAERVRHVQHVSSLVAADPAIDAASATGWAGETRRLIVPAHHRESYEWIAQTQQAVSRGELRVRQIDYENAPTGRTVHGASPYRWWLTTVAWIDHAFSERPLGLSVERAALLGDPLLHLLFLVVAAAFVAWQYGWLAAALVAIGIAGLFPFAAGFLAGAPNDLSFSAIMGFWSVVVLLPGIRILHTNDSGQPLAVHRNFARRWYVAGGIVGGCGLWISVQSQMPVLIGIAFGALASLIAARSHIQPKTDPEGAGRLWRTWAVSGAVTVLIAWLIEFAPSHLTNWELESIHPLYGVAWLGLGELLVRFATPRRARSTSGRVHDIVHVLCAVAAVAVLPAVMWFTQSTAFLPAEGTAYQLTRLPDGITARNFWHWLTRTDLDSQFLATVTPVLLLVPSIGWALRRTTSVHHRTAFAFVLGPCVSSLGFAFAYLSAWHLFDALALTLVLLIATALAAPGVKFWARGAGLGFILLLLAPGVVRLWPSQTTTGENAAPLLEVEGVIERDLARWLAKRIGNTENAIVWAPPDMTNTLYFYGDLRGIGTFAPENAEGLAASFQLARSTANEEALALIKRYQITHVVLPSWEPFFDETVPTTPNGRPVGFLGGLQHWVLPSWLRPMAYQIPRAVKLENYSVQVFEVVDEQEPAVSLSRLAEYFAETGDLDGAVWADESLQRFPADLSALTARAHVLTARGETAGYTRVMDTLKVRLRGRADRFLPWDRRVSLAIALAREQDIDQAREQAQHSLSEINEEKLRSLSPGMLFNFQLLNRALGFEISDPQLRALAKELLPEELRRHLESQ